MADSSSTRCRARRPDMTYGSLLRAARGGYPLPVKLYGDAFGSTRSLVGEDRLRDAHRAVDFVDAAWEPPSVSLQPQIDSTGHGWPARRPPSAGAGGRAVPRS